MHFTLRMTPTIRQLLFSIKAEDAIQAALEQLKAGHKPIIQINRTMESNYTSLIQPGMAMSKGGICSLSAQLPQGHVQV